MEKEPMIAEGEYVRLTDLTKMRIARHILCDTMNVSLPERDQITRMLAERIMELEDQVNAE